MDALELTTQALLGDFTETAMVYRYVTTATEGLATQDLTTVYDAVPCGLNRWGNRLRRSGNSALQSSHQHVEYGAVLYLPIDYSVLAGDVVVVTQLGQDTRYNVLGVASRYATHQELFLIERTVA